MLVNFTSARCCSEFKVLLVVAKWPVKQKVAGESERTNMEEMIVVL